MDAALFSSPTWFYIDNGGQERGPFGSELMLGWYRDGYFPAHLLLRRNIHSHFTTLSSLARGNDNVRLESKPQKVEEASGTENEQEYMEREIKEECFKLEIKEECIKPEIKVECSKLEIKEECIKTEIKAESIKTEIKKEYLNPDIEECLKFKIKEESKSAETRGSETEEEYIEPEISKERIKTEIKEECIKLEAKEEYFNPEIQAEYLNLEVKKEHTELKMKEDYISTRHKGEVPDSHENEFLFNMNAKPEMLHTIYEGKDNLKLKGEIKQGAPFKEKSREAFSKVLKSQTRGIHKRSVSLPYKTHVHLDSLMDEYNNFNPVESENGKDGIQDEMEADEPVISPNKGKNKKKPKVVTLEAMPVPKGIPKLNRDKKGNVTVNPNVVPLGPRKFLASFGDKVLDFKAVTPEALTVPQGIFLASKDKKGNLVENPNTVRLGPRKSLVKKVKGVRYNQIDEAGKQSTKKNLDRK